SEISLSRSAATTVASEPASASPDDSGNQSVHGRAGLYADRNAELDQINTRRRARLHRAFARAARKILCPAAVAPNLQTDLHDCGPRQVLPNCALLSRRRFAGRSAAGVFAARRRDELCYARSDLQTCRRIVCAHLWFSRR